MTINFREAWRLRYFRSDNTPPTAPDPTRLEAFGDFLVVDDTFVYLMDNIAQNMFIIMLMLLPKSQNSHDQKETDSLLNGENTE